ncbi:AsnC-type helix-turn-helix domain-containing protein [Actinopolyspora xinjiangensis]|uniref:AsnC-type helix-turn-helix domain-containing protein n=1 Tax=Actinopolyspora xinjiangensis TaxID=405564 RepID=A0A1H0SIH6_9ACTN|nr:AsnC family protein [Actinopolyspora xinjiangensis]SDP41591.1 AsnC-type helix-turn-helix domain-containing protein [Actinopolyspora xinjiangensis]
MVRDRAGWQFTRRQRFEVPLGEAGRGGTAEVPKGLSRLRRFDFSLLLALNADARRGYAELARETGLGETAV